jgi:ssDNA-binding Zn-finger/Zn-ribbon topoisomerase 1
MLKSIPNISGDLVLSNNDYGYEEILRNFDAAASVTITTFNVSKNRDKLLELLRSLDVPLRVISNIPNRKKVEKENNQDLSDAVAAYLKVLNPEEFGPSTSIYFCFRNHSKVIATDKIGYIGSANYSDESAGNWEFGVVIRDSVAIAQVIASVDEIQKDSIRYYGPQVNEAIVPLMAAASDLRKLHERLGEDFEEVEEREIKDAIDNLRDAINNSDIYLSEGYDGEGTVFDRIDTVLLMHIEEWFESEISVWEWQQARQRLANVENGNVELPVNNDGVPIESAHHDMIYDLEILCEEHAAKVQESIPNLQSLIDEAISQIVTTCNEVSQGLNAIKEPSGAQLTEEKCPKCGKVMLRRFTKAGSFLGCSDFPACRGTVALDNEGKSKKQATTTEHKCEKCNSPMLLRDGRFGEFYSCSSFPKCRVTAKRRSNGSLSFKIESGISCEKCGMPMMERSGRRGAFLGCNGYPKCTNTMALPNELQAKPN